MAQPHKKRLVFCFDGTWNKLDAPQPTNVVLTAESVMPRTRDGDVQVVYYDEGVGTNRFERLVGGVLGAGLLKNLSDAYRTLLLNHTPGDEIYIFGFSRGAFSARSFAGLIANVGILSRKDAARANEAVALYKARTNTDESREALAQFRSTYCTETCVSDEDDAWRVAHVPGYAARSSPRLRVRYLGVWDTVGALGIPTTVMWTEWSRRKYQFHDLRLSSFVESARHAVALDERRVTFDATLWENIDQLNMDRKVSVDADDAPYQQRFFPGTHGGVGGGGDRRGLSDNALEWIWDGARHAGLELDLRKGSRVYDLKPDHTEFVDNVTPTGKIGLWWFLDKVMTKRDRVGPTELYEIAPSARRKWKDDPAHLKDKVSYRPGSLKDVRTKLDALDPVTLGLGQEELAEGTFDLHEVVSGDTLSKISLARYGDAQKWPAIWAANKYKVSDPDKIYIGQVLRIPHQPTGRG